jgi:hypothetical protein
MPIFIVQKSNTNKNNKDNNTTPIFIGQNKTTQIKIIRITTPHRYS